MDTEKKEVYAEKMSDFYIGKCDYGFHYLVRLFGRDILYLDIFHIKRRFLRIFGIMGIHKLKKIYYIFFKNSIWRFGFTNPKGGKCE